MKKMKFYFCAVIIFLNFSTEAQIVNVSINNSFNTEQVIYTFNHSDIIYGLKINGSVTLNTDTSLARVILVDSNNVEYLVYEAYPILFNTGTIYFSNEGDETFYLNANSPYELKVELIDATINISSVEVVKTIISDVETIRNQFLNYMRLNKIESINYNLKEKGYLWIAGDNSFAQLSFNEKKKIFISSKLPNLCGFEYYVGGIFQLPSFKLQAKSNKSFNGHIFDWRNRHGVNWITSIKNQEQEPACTYFAAMASLEANINLYYNQHINADLSEQAFVSCYFGIYRMNDVPGWPTPPLPECASINSPTDVLCKAKSLGAVDENCYPFTNVYDMWGLDNYNQACPSSPWPNSCNICGNLCSDYLDRLWKITDFKELDNPSSYNPNCSYCEQISEDILEENIVQNGPVAFAYSPWSHAMCFVGFGILQEGDTLFPGPIIIPSGSPYIDQTYWIVKNSAGTGSGINGYIYMLVDLDNDLSVASVIIRPIIQPEYTNYTVNCTDADDDGYYWWGIGSKPSTCPDCAPDIADCDDSNPFLGPMDEYGNCTVITEPYEADHEISTTVTWSNTSICGDVYVHSGGNITIDNTDVNIYNEFSVEIGGTLTITEGEIK